MTDVATFIGMIEARGKRVTRRDQGAQAQCPAHDDRTASLSIGEGGDGRVLICCHAGCRTEDVLAALGLSLADLSPEPGDNGRREIVESYDYRDESGELLYQVVRFQPKDFRQRRPDGFGGWTWKLGSTRRVLYRLSEVIAAVKAGRRVWVVEGERDVHALEAAGEVASCNPGGAGKWRREYAKPLRGARVAVIADRDAPGRKHAREVARSLEGIAAEVKLGWPVAGKDVTDHLAAGRGLDEFVPIPGATDEHEAPISVVTLEEFAAVDEPGAEPIVGEPDSVLIPEGGDVMFYGDGGATKTTLTIDLACHLAAGDDWLAVPIPQPRRVLLIENEGPRPLLRHKLRRKLDGWQGASIDRRVSVWQAPWATFTFATEQARAQLAEIAKEREIDVLIAGPLARLGMEAAGTLQEVRGFMEWVADVRRRCGRPLTVLLVHHENKGGAVSGAWEGSGDTLLHVTCPCNGHTAVYVQKARWSSESHGKTLKLQWTAGEGFELEGDRDYKAEIVAFLTVNPWRTTKEIAAPKDADEPGIGAEVKRVKQALEGDPDRFESRTGDAAKAVDRHPNATVWSLSSTQNSDDPDTQTEFSGRAEGTSESEFCVKNSDVSEHTPKSSHPSEFDPNSDSDESIVGELLAIFPGSTIEQIHDATPEQQSLAERLLAGCADDDTNA